MPRNNFIPARDYRQTRSPAFYSLPHTLLHTNAELRDARIQLARRLIANYLCLDSRNVGEPVRGVTHPTLVGGERNARSRISGPRGVVHAAFSFARASCAPSYTALVYVRTRLRAYTLFLIASPSWGIGRDFGALAHDPSSLPFAAVSRLALFSFDDTFLFPDDSLFFLSFILGRGKHV